jgi:hypothetical protein
MMAIHTARQAPEQAPWAAGTDGPAENPGSSPQQLPDLDALYGRLAEADEAEDTKTLAALAWALYGLLGSLVADRNALRARLHQMLATTAGRELRQMPSFPAKRGEDETGAHPRPQSLRWTGRGR